MLSNMESEKETRNIVAALRKMPLFKQLSPTNVHKVLGLCHRQACAEGDILIESNTISDSMFILISGQLAVKGPNDDLGMVVLAVLSPITTVGEMGIFNHERRSASVYASEDSHVLVIDRGPFEALMRTDKELRIGIYNNVVEILSDKILKDNVRARDFVMARVRAEKEQRGLNRKLSSAIALLVERAGMDINEAKALIDERTSDEDIRILIVDDEPSVRNLIKTSLPAYDISEASDGEEGLTSIRADPPDLVISDLRMPKMDGFELAEHLEQEFPHLPVIALSDQVQDGDIEGCNFAGFLEKSMKFEVFEEMIEDTLTER